jgi:hypothetical protein
MSMYYTHSMQALLAKVAVLPRISFLDVSNNEWEGNEEFVHVTQSSTDMYQRRESRCKHILCARTGQRAIAAKRTFTCCISHVKTTPR